jgi:hypothetical protein
MIVCCSGDQHRAMAINRPMHLPHSACDLDECRCSLLTYRPNLPVIPHPNFIRLQPLDFQLGLHNQVILPMGPSTAKKIQMLWIPNLLLRSGLMQTLARLHRSALRAGIPLLFMVLPMTCVGRLRKGNSQPNVHTPTPECHHPPLQHLHIHFHLFNPRTPFPIRKICLGLSISFTPRHNILTAINRVLSILEFPRLPVALHNSHLTSTKHLALTRHWLGDPSPGIPSSTLRVL